jgi:hypothetical protein
MSVPYLLFIFRCLNSLQTITEFETVLPNGTITNINAQNYPNLFTAMKGSGNQFGESATA